MQIKLAVRSRGDAFSTLPAVRQAVRQLDPQLALADIRTLEDIWDGSLSGLREPAWLVMVFAALSALLAALGLYGVVSHSVGQQQREIGIRMALGARSSEVLSMVVRNVLVTIAGGLVIGLVGAVFLTRVTRSLLFEVSALDPSAFVTGAIAMAALALIAAIIPASRATRVDPTVTLRAE